MTEQVSGPEGGNLRPEGAVLDLAIDQTAEAETVVEGAIRAVTENDLRSGSPDAAVVSVMADGVTVSTGGPA